jgi:uroporphyrinogen decarboxylase
VRPILPYLLEGGINCLFPFEVNGCSHPAELLNKYEGELRIMGGVDKIQLGSGREAIKATWTHLCRLWKREAIYPSATTAARRM